MLLSFPSLPSLTSQVQHLLVNISETGKFQKLSVIITFCPDELSLILQCRQKKRQGREGLPVDCHIYGWHCATYMDGIMSEMRSLWIGDYRRYSHSFTLRLGLQTCKVHFKNLLYKWHYRKTVTASCYIAFDFRIRWFSLQGTGFFWSILIQPW